MRRLCFRASTVWAMAFLTMAMSELWAQEPARSPAPPKGAQVRGNASALDNSGRTVAAAEAAQTLEEQKPPPGKGLVLSDAQVRYCLAQIIRIDAVRPVLDPYEKEQVDYFNQVVADYNSRCASYRYRGDTLQREKAPIEAGRSKIEAAARDDYAKRFAPPVQAATTQRPTQAVTTQRSDTSAAAPEPRVEPELATPPAVAAPPRAAKSENTQQSASIPTREPDTTSLPLHPEQEPSPPASLPSARPAPPGEGERRASTPSTVPPPAVPRKAQDGKATASAEKRRSAKTIAPATTGADTPPVVANVQPTTDPDDTLERFTQQIQRIGSDVLDERDYPEEARNKGVGGSSLIEVRFALGGYVKSINLSRSSGVLALDDKALELARALRFPDVPKDLADTEFSVRFPIVFRPR